MYVYYRIHTGMQNCYENKVVEISLSFFYSFLDRIKAMMFWCNGI